MFVFFFYFFFIFSDTLIFVLLTYFSFGSRIPFRNNTATFDQPKRYTKALTKKITIATYFIGKAQSKKKQKNKKKNIYNAQKNRPTKKIQKLKKFRKQKR